MQTSRALLLIDVVAVAFEEHLFKYFILFRRIKINKHASK